MIDCSLIDAASVRAPLVEQCDVIASGALRMLTPFRYPDGSQIDLFIEEPEPLLGTRILSDLGQTTAYLLDLQVKPWATNKRRQMIEDICRELGVEWRGGRFQMDLREQDISHLAPSMLRLAQACIRVSDLCFSTRIWSAGSFQEELEEFLSSIEVRYETAPVELSKKNKEIKFDFRVFGGTTVSLVQSLSAATRHSAHTMATEAFVRWYDLGTSRKDGPQRVTVVDESNDVFKEDDVGRLERVSQVLWFPAEQAELATTLRA